MKAKQRAATRISLASTAIFFPNTLPRELSENRGQQLEFILGEGSGFKDNFWISQEIYSRSRGQQLHFISETTSTAILRFPQKINSKGSGQQLEFSIGEGFKGNVRISQKIYSKGEGRQPDFPRRKASRASSELSPERYIQLAEGSNLNFPWGRLQGRFPNNLPRDIFEKA